METKFTKGEWELAQQSIGFGYYDILTNLDDEENWTERTEWVASTVLVKNMNPEEAEANAKLIAAAPYMFEVCRLLLACKSDADFQSVIRMAKEAIEKATE